jgi:hypothetical protein
MNHQCMAMNSFKTTYFVFNMLRKMNRTTSVIIEQVLKHVSKYNNNVNFYQKKVGSVFLDSLVYHKQNLSNLMFC